MVRVRKILAVDYDLIDLKVPMLPPASGFSTPRVELEKLHGG